MPRNFQLVDGDIEILKLVFEYRVLTIDHLIALTGRRQQMLHRRILKLLAGKLVSRLTFPQQKHIYTLGTQAAPILVSQGSAPKELLEWRTRNNELKELFLRHLLMIVDIHTALALASRESSIKLVNWKQGRELDDRVTIRQSGTRTLPVCPDAFFTLADTRRPEGANRVNCFLEADRSTTTHERFARKLTAYWNYFQQGLHTKKYGIKTFRVATVAITKERAANLCQLAGKVIPKAARKFYLFASLQDCSLTPRGISLERFSHFSLLDPQLLLSDSFTTPHDAQPRPLVPARQ